MGEAVADVAKLALLDVLLDGVEKLLLGDLVGRTSVSKAVMHAAICWGGEAAECRRRRTSSLALVQRGISTTMFRMPFSWSA